MFKSPCKTKYKWPLVDKDYIGQKHTWFLAKFKQDELPNLKNSDSCFSAWRWEDPEKLINLTVAWKKQAYREGLLMLGFVLSDK